MRELFTVNVLGVVEALPQAWLYEPFHNIKKKYKTVETATLELGLVYFAADYRSDFISEENVETRVAKIKKNLYANRNIKIDDLTYKAIKFYEENQDTVKIKLVKAAVISIQKAIDTLSLLDIAGLDEIKKLTEAISKLPEMMTSLTELEKFVKKEEDLEKGIVGAGEKSSYEDG